MDRGTFGKRNQIAQERMVAAIGVLAERFAIPGHAERLQMLQVRDPEVKSMMQREIVADLLEALIMATTPPQPPEPEPAPKHRGKA
jgi:hypothetical protein